MIIILLTRHILHYRLSGYKLNNVSREGRIYLVGGRIFMWISDDVKYRKSDPALECFWLIIVQNGHQLYFYLEIFQREREREREREKESWQKTAPADDPFPPLHFFTIQVLQREYYFEIHISKQNLTS